jgi:hypothetical protein
MSEKDVSEIIDRIQLTEFKINMMPAIDIMIILTLPIEMSTEMVLSKRTRDYTSDKQDLHERQERIQILANEGYNLANFSQHIVTCNIYKVILTIDEIHELFIAKCKEHYR